MSFVVRQKSKPLRMLARQMSSVRQIYVSPDDNDNNRSVSSPGPGLRAGLQHVDSQTAQLFRVKFYKRRLLDERVFPVWRSNGAIDMRQHLQERLMRTVLADTMAGSEESRGGALARSDQRDSVVQLSKEEDVADDDGAEGGADGGTGGRIGGRMGGGEAEGQVEMQQIIEDDVKMTTKVVEQLLDFLHRML